MQRSESRLRVPVVLIAALIAAAVLRVAAPAEAGGFEYPVQGVHALGRGGAFTVKADDPSAIYWNPSRLALLRGTRAIYNHNITRLNMRFERQPLLCDCELFEFPAVNEQQGFFPMGISAAVSTDFGLEDWGFGLGLVGPTAIGSLRYPSGTTAPTRYSFIEAEMMVIFATISAAWKYEELFGFGASLQFGFMPRLDYSMVVVGPGERSTAVATLSDLRADARASDPFRMTAIFSGWVRPLPYMELALSSRAVPINFNASGDIRMSAEPDSVFYGSDPFKVPASVKFTYPVNVQAGVRYFHERASGEELFDIELNFVWEQWSQLDAFTLDFGVDEIDVFGSRIALQRIDIVRNFKDTYSVRLGGQWNVLPRLLTLRLGGLWESAGLPHGYSSVDFPSFERFAISGGISVAWRGVELSLAYSRVFQLPRAVGTSEARLTQQRMTFEGEMVDGCPVNAGVYHSSYDVFAFGLGVHFNSLFSD